MLDLLAQTDPLSVGGWLILLVALGMYPVGILLPGCCGCSGSPCAQCSGSLPNTVTVTFGTLADEIAGPYNHEVEFRSWYESPAPAETGPSYGYPGAFGYPYGWPSSPSQPMGSGAVARVTTSASAVFGQEGGITGVQLLSGGSGYARLGRAAPTLTITGSGSGATFTPTFSTSGEPPVWAIASIAGSGGSGYTAGETLTITAAAGDTVVAAATATIVSTGAGGAVTGVTVQGGGSYYREDASLPPRVATVSARVFPDRMGPYQPPLASHAKIRATIDTNTASATFGQITGLTIDAAGAGYTSRTAWLGKRCCKPLYDGKAFVLQRTTPGAFEEADWCVYEGLSCNGWAGLGETYLRFVIPNFATPPSRSAYVPIGGYYGGYVEVPRVAPRLPYLTVNTFSSPAPCRMYFESATRITDCAAVNLTLEAGSTATATVVGGGSYQSPDPTKVCLSCCPAGAPVEVSATLAYMSPPGSPTELPDMMWQSEYDYWQEEGYPSPPGTYALQWGGVFGGLGWRYYDYDTGHTVGVSYSGCDSWFNQSTRFPGSVSEELLKDVYRNGGTRYTGLVQWDDHVSSCGSDCDRKCLLTGLIGNEQSQFIATDLPTASTPISSNGTTADAGYEITSDYYTTSAHNGNGDTKAFAFNTFPLTKELCDRCQSSVCSLSGKTFSIVKNYGGLINPAWRVIATLTIT